jgi:hypothetical protein
MDSPRKNLPGDGPFVFLILASTLALPVLRALSMGGVTRWWIPAFEVVLLLRAGFPLRPWSRARTHLLLGLFLCLCGDILINWTPWKPACIGCFALAHLNLLWIFLHRRGARWADLPKLVPWLLASAGILFACARGLSHPWMALGMAAYLLLLDLMVWRGVALLSSPRPAGATLLAGGAVLFWATDQLVILQTFRASTCWVVATWICYPPALSLLALSSRFLSDTRREA